MSALNNLDADPDLVEGAKPGDHSQKTRAWHHLHCSPMQAYQAKIIMLI